MSDDFYNECGEIILTDKEKAEFWERFVKGLAKELEFYKNINKDKSVKVKELEAQIEKAESVIRFYADKENWNSKKYRDGALMLFEEIGGEKAREYFESKEVGR